MPGSSPVVVSSDSDGSRYDEEPSQLEELADFMEQVWGFFFLSQEFQHLNPFVKYVLFALTKNTF